MVGLKNRIIFFSGGKGSFAVACLVKEKYPDDNIILYFTDTKWEDEDLYRFIDEASDKLKLPMLTHADGRNPIELMYDQKVVFNSRIGQCSIVLKVNVASNFIKKGIEPKIVKWRNKQYLKDQNFRENAILYFGIDWTEMHRLDPVQRNWKPFKVEAPLVDEVVNVDELLDKYDIKQPRLYDLGFAHNNCKGRCVKAGQGHFTNLKEKLPGTFKEIKEQEFYMQQYVSHYHTIRRLEEHGFDDEVKQIYLDDLDNCYGPYFRGEIEKPKVFIPPNLNFTVYSFMKKQKDNVVKPYTIRDLEIDIKDRGLQMDMFDIGGCGCFLD